MLLCAMAGTATAATVTQSITYQGTLTNAAGNPLTGTYSMTFNLYNIASGGSPLATDTHSVTVSNGLFTTSVSFDSVYFDGQALWLGITVESDSEMTPRQEIRPVPYALSLRPGAVIQNAFFTTNMGGISDNQLLGGVNISTIFNYNPGVHIKTSGYRSHGVYIATYNTGANGIESHTNGPSSNGVYARTEGDTSYGINSFTTGPNSIAVNALSNQSTAIWADTQRSDQKYGVQTPDIIRAFGYETEASDVAEYMPVAGEIAPGTVLIIGIDGKLQPSTTADDTRVAGIVSTDPGVFLGAMEGGNPGEALIAVAGRVPCNVDASYGRIQSGDLLTTSDTPGYAMKAQPVDIGGVQIYRPGTIIGKAAGSLNSGTGTIDVLVALQ